MTFSTTLSKFRCNPILATLPASIFMLALGGCASGSSSSASSNPFAKDGTTEGVQVNVMRAFGDSYTDTAYTDARGITNWAENLQEVGLVSESRIYAIGGAKAASGEVRSFDIQIDNWQATDTPIGEGDLTVAYFGYNDIYRYGSSDELAAAMAGYTAGINELVAAGAASDTNRIFVVQIHDWSRNPGVLDSTQYQVDNWNEYIAGVANGNTNIIAVDLQTVFDRVYADPTSWGFTNVTTADGTRTDTDTLYYDSLHFGSKGMLIISRVFQHYLTRAWDWANALNAGTDASIRLNEDIDEGLLYFRQQQIANGFQPGFNLIPLGVSQSATTHSLSNAFIPFSDSGAANKSMTGLAFNFSSKNAGINSATYGLAINQGDVSTLLDSAEERNSVRYSTNSASAYWTKPFNNFLLTSKVSHLTHDFSQTGSDSIIARSITNSREAASWSMENKLRYSWRTADNSLFTPWVSLINQNTALDAATMSTLYTTDVSYAGNTSTERLMGIGIDMELAPIQFSNGKKLHFGGGINHLQSLSRDDIAVTMVEAGGSTSIEMVQREAISRTQLSFNTRYELSRLVNLNASYSVEAQDPEDTQTLQVRANFSF